MHGVSSIQVRLPGYSREGNPEAIKQSADKGCKVSQYQLAMIYVSREVAEKNPAAALSYLRKSADQRYGPALDVLVNPEQWLDREQADALKAAIKADKWMTPAKGYEVEYRDSKSTDKDKLNKAIAYYGKAADCGCQEAERKWLILSVERGSNEDAQAIYEYGVHQTQGTLRFEVDVARGNQFIDLAAEKGYVRAIEARTANRLVNAHDRLLQVTLDAMSAERRGKLAVATVIYDIADKMGNDAAKEQLNAIKVTEATERAREAAERRNQTINKVPVESYDDTNGDIPLQDLYQREPEDPS